MQRTGLAAFAVFLILLFFGAGYIFQNIYTFLLKKFAGINI
jgi:hypothetical protein